MTGVNDTEILTEMLIRHEGLELKPYRDTVGKLTVGVGRNLTDVGISKSEAMYLLQNDIRGVQEQLAEQAWFGDLDSTRQIALTDMAFNLGVQGLLKFQNMIAALERKDYETAGKEMLDSRWAGQVGRRATELSQIVRSGVLNGEAV